MARPPGRDARSTIRSWPCCVRATCAPSARPPSSNFRGPLQTIMPWATNLYTERLIERVRAEFGADFWGFWMLGGMAGGGMGFIFDPARRREAQDRLQVIMSETKRDLETSSPFAMEPVVYDFAINEQGSVAELLHGERRAHAPGLLHADRARVPARRPARRSRPFAVRSWTRFGAACRTRPELSGMVQTLFDQLLPQTAAAAPRLSLAERAAGRARLRPRAARADPRRPARRPHRPGPEPAARAHQDRGRAGRTM